MPHHQQFLEKVAKIILQKDKKDLLNTLVVFPNNRSEIFLKGHLKQQAKADLWLPEMITIDQLMVQLSGLSLLDPLVVYLKLFEIHQAIEKEKARSLDDFLNWAPLMLNDFNEIDLYMVPADSLFSELSEVKAMERWNLDGKPLTSLQTQYLNFFHSLIVYYQKLQKELLDSKTAYKGLAYRRAAEKAIENTIELPWQNFVFVGFNALTESEKTIVHYLKAQYTLEYFVDADRFYMGNDHTDEQETGRFLRDTLKSLKIDGDPWICDLLQRTTKQIEIAQASKQMGQVKYAGQVLRQWFSNPHFKVEQTAVVLMDENMLVPLLAEVPLKRGDNPEQDVHYNVTMGYPLSASPFVDFIHQWLKILITRSEDSQQRVWIPGLVLLFNNALVSLVAGDGLNIFLENIRQKNIFFEKTDMLLDEHIGEEIHDLISLLFSAVNTPRDFLIRLNGFLKQLSANPQINDPEFVLLRNQMISLTRIVKTLGVMLSGQIEMLSFVSVQKIFEKLISRAEISLKGEPLSGVQVMGLLETRNLDFENIILLGANEGLLPETGFQDSFIPFDLKRAYQLPMPKAKTTIISYHFFRLLQRAGNVVMVYNSEAESLGGGEPSRFIRQIEHVLQKRNHNLKVVRSVLNIPLHMNVQGGEMVIEKLPLVIEKLAAFASGGISPSALSAYIRCPLQFYFKYVIKPKLPDQLETSIESNTFGSVVHASLEKLYTPFVGTLIDPVKLLKGLVKLDDILQNSFQEIYGTHDLSYGKNLLTVRVAKEYVRRFVRNEAEQLKKNPLELMGLELRLQTPFVLNGKDVKIKGFIDRIDKEVKTGILRIVDYKTGSVAGGELKVKDWPALITDVKYAKALQVLLYQWLYQKEKGLKEGVSSGLISLRSSSGSFMPVSFDQQFGNDRFESAIGDLLSELLSEIFDEQKPFRQTKDIKVCAFCDFKQLCMR